MHHVSRSSPPGLPHSRSRPGFTLVELIIAITVLAVGLLALTAAGAAIVKLERRGDALSRNADAAETRLEVLRVDACAAASGSSTVGQTSERWTVVSLSAATLQIVDSVSVAGAGGRDSHRAQVYRSAARC